MSTSFADRKKAATPAESTVHLCLDLQLHDRRREAYQQFERLREAAKRGADEERTTLDDSQPDDALTAQLAVIDEIDAELNAKSEPYVLRKLAPHKWRDLGEQHPASKEDIDQAKAQRAEILEANPDLPASRLRQLAPIPDVDSEAFWPAAISACAHDPKLTVEDVLWLRDGEPDDGDESDGDSGDDENKWPGLPPDEFSKLMVACQELHGSGVQVPKELLRIAATMSRAPNGTTPAAKGSPSRSSAGGSRKTGKRTG